MICGLGIAPIVESSIPTSCGFGQRLSGDPLVCALSPMSVLNDVFALPASTLYKLTGWPKDDGFGLSTLAVSAGVWGLVLYAAFSSHK